MAISFLQVPVGVKVPGVYVEFDTSKAIQGPSIQSYRALIIGQKLSTGTKPAGQIDIITSEAQARQFYGAGSMLFHMLKTFIGENKGLNELRAIALDDLLAGVAAVGRIDIDVTTAEAGTLNVMIGGRQYQVGVTAGQTAISIAAALVAVINADADRHVNAVVGVDTTHVDLTYRHKGEVGNGIDIRLNYFSGQVNPVGVTAVITPMGGITPGTGDPVVSSVITAMGEMQFHVIGWPYSNAAALGLMQTELVDRWGPVRQNDGQLFYCKKESFSSHITYLGTRNNEQETVMNIAGPTPTFEWAANITAVIAREGQQDPARPFQTVSLSRVLAPKDSEDFPFSEQDLLLKAGSSTFFVDSGGTVRIQRMRTTRTENAFAALDESLADLNPKLTLSYLRFDFRTNFLVKFPRHKLADDGTRFGPGQAIITPKIGKAEAIAKFRQWEELGLVEGIDQFKRDLIVERNISDPNRLDFLLPPDLINQLRVTGVQIGFLL